MKTKLFIVVTFALILAFAHVNTALAQTAVAGVSQGEMFDYDYSIFWESTNPSASPPDFFVDLNQTELVQIEIIAVTGSRIDISVIKHFTNESQKTDEGYLDIDTGVVEVPYGFLIISANLSAGQQLYPSGGHQTISSTYFKSYPNGQRETNRYLSQTETDRLEINFDRLKGIAVDYSYQTIETSGGYTTTIQEILTNTNSDVWTVPVIPELSTLLIPLTLFVATAALLVARTAKKRLTP